MLQRALLFWLILSMLGYGLALAIDVHSAQMQPAASIVAADAGDQDKHAGPACCDHCVHGSAHLLGLHAAFAFQIAPAGAPLRSDDPPALRAPPFQKPLKPPALS